MPYNNTGILQLQIPDTSDTPATSYVDKLYDDQLLSSSLAILDNWSGLMTGSCYSIFGPSSGSLADLLAGGNNDGFGMEYSRTDRVIQEVVCWVNNTGSGGVTAVDVLIQQGVVQPANFSSIFAAGASKPGISGGLGGTVQPAATLGNRGLPASFVSGSNTVWPKNTLLQVKMATAAGVGGASPGRASGLTVQVFWKPSGSAVPYGA